jgi:hypothetical protein
VRALQGDEDQKWGFRGADEEIGGKVGRDEEEV